VADLQHIDRLQQAALGQSRFDRRLGIAGEQRAEGVATKNPYHRRVVDVVVRQRAVRIGLVGVQDRERGALIERQLQAGPRVTQSPACERDEARVGRIGERSTGIEHQSDPIATQHLHQSRDVVLVRMREHHDVDAVLKERQRFANPSQRQVRVRAAVDEHGGARW
jgi:hypothetical protein